ncbi:MAG: phospholipase D family protein [Rhizobiaceae bacterium]|nr:phospholipase D family protein [Rhizobiaceae bacterium]
MEAGFIPSIGDRVLLGESGLLPLSDSAEAFATRALSARDASRSLDLLYYRWHDDQTGRALLGEVMRAADRGVRVRILLDDIDTRDANAAYAAVRGHANIALKLFNPSRFRAGGIVRLAEFLWRRFRLTRRMHLKAWIADGSSAIVGGRNIGDAYFDLADTNFRDLDMFLLGPSAEQTSAIFEAFWTSEAAVSAEALAGRETRAARRAKPQPSRECRRLLDHVDRWGVLRAFLAARAGQIHWTKSARVISDPPEKVSRGRRRSWLSRELLPLIKSTRRRLEIVSPYFIPGLTGSLVLERMVRRGVEVDVLTNSLAATDVAAVHGAYANYRVRLLKAGVRLFEMQPFQGHRNMSILGSKGASLHTKAFLVDRRAGFVGSFNFDPRSVSLNAEMGVVFEDERLAEQLGRWIEEEKSPAVSYRVSLSAGGLVWNGQRNEELRSLRREPEASFMRRLLAGLVRYLPVESEL